MNTKGDTLAKDPGEKLYSKKEVDAIILAALVKATGYLNGIPHHTHQCTDGDHTWFCPSPYCEDVSSVPRTCVEHGGEPPVVKGREPWRAAGGRL